MEVQQSLQLSRYIRILQHNNYSAEDIARLKQEFIHYVEQGKVDNPSLELQEFMAYIAKSSTQSSSDNMECINTQNPSYELQQYLMYLSDAVINMNQRGKNR